MDRYVIREPRLGNPQPNQMFAMPSTSMNNNNTTSGENPFYGTYGPVFPNAQQINNPGIIIQNPGQIQSGIDPQYLASYSGSTNYISGQQQNQGQHLIPMQRDFQEQQYIQGQQNNQGQQLHGQLYVHGQQQIPGQQYMHGKQHIPEQPYMREQQHIPGQPYMREQQQIHGQQYIQPQQNMQQHAFQGQQRYKADLNLQNIVPETTDAVVYTKYLNKNVVGAVKPAKKFVNGPLSTPKGKSQTQTQSKQSSFSIHASTSTKNEDSSLENVVMALKEVTNKPTTVVAENETQNLRKIRLDKLQALNKSGPRAFSGPVEKVLKWHKVLKEIGVLVLYEIVAKCLSVRQGKPCEKILVIKDENGPAMEVVYYEIDFLFPDLILPCTVRVVGRMMVGTCRLQAFSVRVATGDDIATLPRRAAVAQHHIAKLAKDYSQ
ncbi:PREDICTED: GATA zinc finger domain-containing protein 10-like [Papilio xuthus]|uniref:GATA zinc finger domain-containing protein 10-like n=1 Tax=Papilio xuthus TaxID=66420 RepID=A0AAJ7E5V3_PAPXU|nr:PREDICTED: GATA zinc finger domain-containing protein 10-like [Papilio xuthus]